jgi:glycosyltransferase involved in cell wall biosynthesis
MSAKNVSVIICTRNVEQDIRSCIESIEKNHPGEILVVDGKSTDKTLDIVNALSVKNISDGGRGLAYARRVGVENTNLPFVMFIGPDNILGCDFIEKLIRLKEEWRFDVASVSTRIYEPQNFWDRGMDFRWKCNMGTPGETDVPGTPNVYDRRLFEKVHFSDKDFGGADDTDLCEQLKNYGYKLGIVPLAIFEKNGWTSRFIWNRFKFYGTGDNCFYKQYKSTWTLSRRLLSITHPLRQTISYSRLALLEKNYEAIPWLFYTMVARYYGWISYKRGETKNYSSY